MKQVGLFAAVAVLAVLALVPQASAVIYDTDIYHVQQAYFVVNDTVRVDSVIVTAIDLKPTTYGLLIQERAGGPFSGILAYLGGTRPDTLLGGIHMGDMVTVQGRYAEYTTGTGVVSEIDWCTVTMVQAGYGEVTPQLMSCHDLGEVIADSTCAEKWEGVMLAVDTVVCVAGPLPFDEWRIVEAHNHPGSTCTKDTVRIAPKLVDPTLAPAGVGDTLALIRGPFSWEYSFYRIWPRADSDVVYLSLPPGPGVYVAYPVTNTRIDVVFDRAVDLTTAQTAANYTLLSGTNITAATRDGSNTSIVHLTTAAQPATQLDVLTVCDVNSMLGVPMDSCETYSFRAGITPISFIQTPSVADSSQCVDQQVTTTGIVTTGSTTFGGPYFMQTRAGGQWNGIYVYQFTLSNLIPGDSVVVSGVVDEYYGCTELISIDYQQRIPVAAPVKVKKVTPSMIVETSPTAESYEGAMVRVDSAYIFTGLDTHNEWRIGTGTDSVWVAHRANYTYVPTVGCLVSVVGPLDYYYGYALQPRSNADITEFGAGVTPGTLSLALSQNAPNPFGMETSIRFVVPLKTQVDLSVYDVSGRLVKSVYSAVPDPGQHAAKWDGRDGSGAGVSPGVYFIRLATPDLG